MAQGAWDQIMLAVDTKYALGHMSNWLTKHTKLDGNQFSLLNHEYQEAIINDTASRIAHQKCSQIGASELSARLAAAITAISQGKHIMYVMPTAKFADKFSASRITPIIEESEVMTNLCSKGSIKSTSLKQIGSSFLHMGGTSGAATGAISVPASFISVDEYDFCVMAVVGKYESRLKHAAKDEFGVNGSIRWFSTPTLPNFGINAKFLKSDQKYYMVRCSGCGNRFDPDYFEDIVVPGADKALRDFLPHDVNNAKYDIMKAYIACPKCQRDVWQDLINPQAREWVAKYPDRRLTNPLSGYQTYPWDVPTINSIPSILKTMDGYEGIMSDYYNFTVGIPWADNENTFNLEAFSIGYSTWNDTGGSGYCIGCDIGKTSHIVIGRENGTKVDVVFMERFVSAKGFTIKDRLLELTELFGIAAEVIDNSPDFTTVMEITASLDNFVVFGCEYTASRPKKSEFKNIQYDPENHRVQAFRTGTLKALLKLHNAGNINYPDPLTSGTVGVEIDEMKMNFANTKKQNVKSSKGGTEERFIKDGADHYCHAMNYLLIAITIANSDINQYSGIEIPTKVVGFSTLGNPSKSLPRRGNLLGNSGWSGF